MLFKLAILGRPNVGKSTLFNRLCERKMAITSSVPGTTRDRREGIAKFAGMEFMIVDTAGIEEKGKLDTLEKQMMEQSLTAVEMADALVLVIDGRDGITTDDKAIARKIHKSKKPSFLLINKCEAPDKIGHIEEEVERLGFGESMGFISAEHNLGFGYLQEFVLPLYQEFNRKLKEINADFAPITDKEQKEKHIQVAIMGRPNCGKSTFINSLLSEERLVTSDVAGTTRDSIRIAYTHNKRNLYIFDTAGIRKRSTIKDELEKFSVLDSLVSLRFCHVAILLIDAAQPFNQQDLHILKQIVEEGRGVVIGVNKWDTLSKNDGTKLLDQIRSNIASLAPQIKDVPIITISAKNDIYVKEAIDQALAVYDNWNKKISTGRLNKWLTAAQEEKSPGLYNGHPIKLKYISQIKIRPPQFVLFVNHINAVKESYMNFLNTRIKKEFSLHGVPVKILLKKSENPYHDNKKSQSVGSRQDPNRAATKKKISKRKVSPK